MKVDTRRAIVTLCIELADELWRNQRREVDVRSNQFRLLLRKPGGTAYWLASRCLTPHPEKMTRIAITITTNYPENIWIDSGFEKKSGKHGAFCYLMRDGQIHRILLSTNAFYATADEAKAEMTKTAEWYVRKLALSG